VPPVFQLYWVTVMARLAVLLVLCFSACALAYVDYELIEKVNTNPASTWKAGENAIFKGKTLDEIKRLMGTKVRRVNKRIPIMGRPVEPNALPASFDARTAWPGCKSLSMIRNQAECGSCWAFGAVEAFTDRWCIASNQTENPIFSPANMVSCDQFDSGCEGGNLESAWQYLQDSGVPSDECQPYNIPTCPPDQQPCLNFVDTPKCQSTCYDSAGNSTGPITTRYKADNGRNVGQYGNDISEIKAELMKRGPVEAAFSVYADFVHYKSGVYSHQSGQMLGGHAVKIIGWGKEDNTPYWLISNSWTTSWGDEGYFKIKMGDDECGIEDGVTVGDPVYKH